MLGKVLSAIFKTARVSRQGSRRAPGGDAGLTLVEMLVVLAIVAVAAGAVALSVGRVTQAPSVESEARRFASRLQAAADDAMLGDRTLALTVDKSGYGFATVEGGRLEPRAGNVLGFHRLPAGIVVTLSVAPPVMLGVDGSGTPMAATVESGRQRWIVTYDGMTATAAPAPAT